MIQFETLKTHDKVFSVNFEPLTILCLDLFGCFKNVK